MKKLLMLCVALAAATAAIAGDVFTAKVLDRTEMNRRLVAAGIPVDRLPMYAADHYAEFNRAELMSFYAQFRRRADKRLVRHDDRFNCFAYSWAMVTEASFTAAHELWHSYTPAWRAAMVPVSYVTEEGKGHCVLLILTNEGAVWWDPQAGLARPLTAMELATVWYPQA